MTEHVIGPGDRLVGRYRLLDLLGAGEMGVVWRAADELLGRTVAVKRIGPAGRGPAEVERARRRILREGRIAAMVDHPRLLGVLDLVTDAGEPWLVLEHVDARSWASLWQQHGPAAPGAAARIGAQVAEALAALHRAGVVHGDVTPENVLVTRDGEVRLAEFGVAHLIGDDHELDMTGFRDYRAPEVVAGAPPGPASDVFALGAAVYEAVEGVPVGGSGEDGPARLSRPPRRAGPLTGVLVALLQLDPARRPDATAARSMLGSVAADSGSAVLPRGNERPG